MRGFGHRRRSMIARRLWLALVAALGIVADARVAAATPPTARIVDRSPVGASYLETIGPHAGWMLAPSTGRVGALVALPRGTPASAYGLDAVAPDIGRIRTTPENLRAFARAHPELRVEVAPPLKPLLDRTG